MEKLKKILGTNLAFLIILTVIVFVIYGKSINYEFTNHDDDILIVRNINFISDISNLPKLFLTSCYYSNDYQYYRPMLTFSFALEAIFFKADPKIYHFTNILMFIFAVYLMYIFLLKLKFNKTILKFLCLLMAVHPIFASCIVWIPARNDTLLMIFSMLSLIFFINYLKQNKVYQLLAFILFFTLALFTKETAIIFIFLCILLIYCFNLKIKQNQIIKIISILIPIITIYFILRNFSVAHIDLKEYSINWQGYISNILFNLMMFVYKFIFPVHIPIMLYDVKINFFILTINIVIFVLLCVLYYKNTINRKFLIFSLIWIFLCLLPTFLLQKSHYFFVTHRLILPLLGITIILHEFISKILTKFIHIKYLYCLFTILFLFFSYISYIRADKYKNANIYIQNAIHDASNSPMIMDVIAQQYLHARNFYKAKESIDRAILLCQENYKYQETLAFILQKEGNLDEAEKIYSNLISLSKKHKSLCLKRLSEIYIAKNNLPRALNYAEQAYFLKPHIKEFAEHLATVYAKTGRYKDSSDILINLLRYDKKNDNYYYNLSLLSEALNDVDKSIWYVQKAMELNKTNTIYKELLIKLTNNKNI